MEQSILKRISFGWLNLTLKKKRLWLRLIFIYFDNIIVADEYSLRRLHEMVEELYALLVCHLLTNERAVKPPAEPQRRRGASCTDDQKNSPNIKRDGGDSDSDPDSCAAATIATNADSVFAEVADLVQRRRYPGELLTPMTESRENEPRPSGSGAPNPCRCSCQSGGSRGLRNVGSDSPMTSGALSPGQGIPQNAETKQERSGAASIFSVFRGSVLGTTVSATVACFIGFRLLYCTNFFNFFYLR